MSLNGLIPVVTLFLQRKDRDVQRKKGGCILITSHVNNVFVGGLLFDSNEERDV